MEKEKEARKKPIGKNICNLMTTIGLYSKTVQARHILLFPMILPQVYAKNTNFPHIEKQSFNNS